MDIRTLRYFLVTAQERNFTKAANKLCMAQPPLSRQIKLLEEELGVTLFIRNSRQHFTAPDRRLPRGCSTYPLSDLDRKQ